MRARVASRWLVVVLAAVTVFELAYRRPVLPWSGTLTMAAILAYAWIGGAGRLLVAGVAALAVHACLVDSRSAGAGWPAAALTAAPGWRGVVEAEFVLAAAGCLAGAVFTLAGGRPRSRLAMAGVGGAAVLAASVAVVSVRSAAVRSAAYCPASTCPAGPDVTALVLLWCVVALLAVASGVAVVSGRRARLAGCGLAVLTVLGLVMAAGVAGDSRTVRPHSVAERSPWFTVEGLRYGQPREANTGVASVLVVGTVATAEAESEPEPGPIALWPDDIWTATLDWSEVPAPLGALLLLAALLAVLTRSVEVQP